MFKQKGSRINVRSEENGRGVVFSAELACLPFRIPLPVPPLVPPSAYQVLVAVDGMTVA